MIRVGTRRERPRRAFDIWQIIYIDLMTNVMIFFIILWAIQTRQSKPGVSDTTGTQTVKMVNLPGDVLFPSGSARLSKDGQGVLGKLFKDDTGTVLGLISMFDSLGSVVTVEQLSPQLALALKCTLYGALFSSLYKISATRFEQRLTGLGYDFDTLCRALKVIFDNKAVIEVQR